MRGGSREEGWRRLSSVTNCEKQTASQMPQLASFESSQQPAHFMFVEFSFWSESFKHMAIVCRPTRMSLVNLEKNDEKMSQSRRERSEFI